jgi:hypothetical protein
VVFVCFFFLSHKSAIEVKFLESLSSRLRILKILLVSSLMLAWMAWQFLPWEGKKENKKGREVCI